MLSMSHLNLTFDAHDLVQTFLSRLLTWSGVEWSQHVVCFMLFTPDMIYLRLCGHNSTVSGALPLPFFAHHFHAFNVNAMSLVTVKVIAKKENQLPRSAAGNAFDPTR